LAREVSVSVASFLTELVVEGEWSSADIADYIEQRLGGVLRDPRIHTKMQRAKADGRRAPKCLTRRPDTVSLVWGVPLAGVCHAVRDFDANETACGARVPPRTKPSVAGESCVKCEQIAREEMGR
jgi:hypothetical protein